MALRIVHSFRIKPLGITLQPVDDTPDCKLVEIRDVQNADLPLHAGDRVVAVNGESAEVTAPCRAPSCGALTDPPRPPPGSPADAPITAACQGLDFQGIIAKLKALDVPIEVTFTRLPSPATDDTADTGEGEPDGSEDVDARVKLAVGRNSKEVVRVPVGAGDMVLWEFSIAEYVTPCHAISCRVASQHVTPSMTWA